MPVATIGLPVIAFVDEHGRPAFGGRVLTFLAGTDELAPTYKDATGTLANTNPVLLNERGEATFWFDTELVYDLVPMQANGTLLPRQSGIKTSGGGNGDTSFLQTGTGAVTRQLGDRGKDWVSAFDFMTAVQVTSVRSGSLLNVTEGLRLAHDTGLLVEYPAGTFVFSPFTIEAGGMLGAGRGLTRLLTNDTSSADLITYSGLSIPELSGMTIESSLSKTDGYALRFLASSGQLVQPNIDNVRTLNVPGGIYFSNSAQFDVSRFAAINYKTAGIRVENTEDSDSGDSFISNVFLNTSVPTGTTYGIWHRSSGGLKIDNFKILGGDSGYVMGWVGATTGNVLFSNGSIEACANFPMFFGRDSGSGNFGAVLIDNVQTGNAKGISTDTTPGFLNLMTIANCYLHTIADNATALALNSVSHISIGKNILHTNGDPGSYGIAIQNCTNGKVAPQVHVSTMPAKRTASSGSPSVVFETDRQSGANVSVTTSTASAAPFYTGLTAVVFPTPFSLVPVVTANVGSAGGGVSAVPEAVTQSGFNFRVYGLANGGVVSNCTWDAEGFI